MEKDKGGIFIEKFEFTYYDYLNYCDSQQEIKYEITEEEFICVEEESAKYYLNGTEEKIPKKRNRDKKHDKIFKDILQSKKEMSKLISYFTKYNIKPEELEKYNANYITNNFKYKQADIVYKVKGKEIYYLIEHQTKVDATMAYRILNYCVEIIRNVVENIEANKRLDGYPIIRPIVLYTGNQKWTANLSFSDNQPYENDDEIKPIDIKYKLIDVNEYEVKELLKENTMLTNAMILEKCKNNEEVVESIKMIVENQKGKRQLSELKRLVLYLYEDVPLKKLKEIIKLIEESESEESMSTIRERLREEYINERREGIREKLQEIVTRMIKMNLENDFIKAATGAKENEIEKIRKEIM